ncbi:MAG: TonB-dependent receptor [Deltaproteobacteria bacterium]|nr:TonB-dependent receptor [Deltaproteobacteria bacterium]
MKRDASILIFAMGLLYATTVMAKAESAATPDDENDIQVTVEYADDALPDGETPQVDTSNKPKETTTQPTDSPKDVAASAPIADTATAPEKSAPTRKIANFTGVLVEKGSRRPIADTEVYIKDTDLSATTDADGRFAFYNLAAGTYEVVVPTTNYETYKTGNTIVEGQRTEVTYYLVPRSHSAMEVVVRDKKVEKEVSRSVIHIEEAELVPGTGGDALKAIESMPGVARGMGDGNIVIRGSNAEDSKFYIDGHEIYSIFHFGGIKSTYNSKLIDSFELMTGGFSAQHGLATGGVVNVQTRAPRSDRWGGYMDASLIDTSFLVEGPINDKMEVAVAARRSTTDLILKAIDLNDKIDGLNFTTYPMYWDYQAKWNYRINKRHSLGLDIYGDKDGMALNLDMVDDSDPNLTGAIDFSYQGHNLFIHHRYDNGVISNHLSPGVYLMKDESIFGKYYFNGDYALFDIKDDLKIKLGKNHTLGAGIGLTPRLAKLSANMIQPPKEGDVAFTFTGNDPIRTNSKTGDLITSAYVLDEMQIGNLLLVPSLRFDHESKLNTYGLGPRLGARYQIVKPFTLKASGGVYHRVPDFDEFDEHFGNGGLEMERAIHAVGGFEWAITDTIDLDIQGYYKWLDNMVAARETDNGMRHYDNSGEGYVYGGEVMLRHNWTNRFFGWISYSVSKSMRNDGPGTDYRPFDMDQRHNLIAVASWQFTKDWRLGLRFQYTSGEPYTRIRSRIYNGDNGTYMPVYNEDSKNQDTRDAYHRLDLRLDKQWVFNTWVLHTYLDVQNVYLHKNQVDTMYNYDYTENVSITDLPILPSIGVTAEF